MKNDPFKIYRTLRLAWFFSFASIIAAIMLAPTIPIILGICIAIYVAITLYLFLFRCPSCGKLYCVKFGFITIAWPFFNACLHCKQSLSINNE